MKAEDIKIGQKLRTVVKLEFPYGKPLPKGALLTVKSLPVARGSGHWFTATAGHRAAYEFTPQQVKPVPPKDDAFTIKATHESPQTPGYTLEGPGGVIRVKLERPLKVGESTTGGVIVEASPGSPFTPQMQVSLKRARGSVTVTFLGMLGS